MWQNTHKLWQSQPLGAPMADMPEYNHTAYSHIFKIMAYIMCAYFNNAIILNMWWICSDVILYHPWNELAYLPTAAVPIMAFLPAESISHEDFLTVLARLDILLSNKLQNSCPLLTVLAHSSWCRHPGQDWTSPPSRRLHSWTTGHDLKCWAIVSGAIHSRK